ncbi:CRISPR-associated endonuclease Cas1 [Balnearium lithotrophicum]|uniref:CRISPR-associated endonuclease Cas1 n=1 Tax=Balnearium lithotrophicum TaxID=223788 RepID=UPI00163D52C0|nr:CRISPR-associated endonuclease Cas1 [Balnearium lithotrophicum]
MFVTTPGARVSKKNNELIVEIKNEKKRIPIGVINHVFLIGSVNITASAIKFLSSRGRFLFLLNKFGKVISIVYPELLGSDNSTRAAQYFIFSREDQYFIFSREEKKLEITKELLKRKVFYSYDVIRNIFSSRKLKSEGLEDWRESILSMIDSGNDNQAMLGIDGQISKFLYSKFSSFNESPFYFDRREYYPPKDPVNALLSLSFSIFYSLMFPILISKGFDPYLGFFHIKRGKHGALCSDVMEIARPKIIEFVFNTINDEFLEISDFVQSSSGVFLKKDALKSFLKLYSDVIIYERSDLTLAPVLDFVNWLRDYLKNEVSNYL